MLGQQQESEPDPRDWGQEQEQEMMMAMEREQEQVQVQEQVQEWKNPSFAAQEDLPWLWGRFVCNPVNHHTHKHAHTHTTVDKDDDQERLEMAANLRTYTTDVSTSKDSSDLLFSMCVNDTGISKCDTAHVSQWGTRAVRCACVIYTQHFQLQSTSSEQHHTIPPQNCGEKYMTGGHCTVETVR
jgi:hypothetical protein